MAVPLNELHRVVPRAVIVKDGRYLVLRRSGETNVFLGSGMFPAEVSLKRITLRRPPRIGKAAQLRISDILRLRKP